MLVVLILMAIASLVMFLKSSPVPVAATDGVRVQSVSSKPSIAVLPFTNLSGDPAEDYLSDGITEQIITALAKIPGMLVIARNSSYVYKGKPTKVQEVGRELGVRYVLEGSVQQSGDRIRITAHLIDAATGHHLRAESYERDMKDLFSLQDDITKQVITALQVKLTDGELARVYGKGTQNLDAYLKVMKGAYHVYGWDRNGNEVGRGLFHEAIMLDPNYAMAYTLLGWTYRHEAVFGWTATPAKSYQKALELGQKALLLGGEAPEPYMLFAAVYASTRQPQKALEAAKKGLSLDPDRARANYLYGLALFYLGEFRQAMPWFEKAITIDPLLQPNYQTQLAWSYFWLGKTEKSIAMLEKAARHYPKYGYVRAILALSLLQAGKPEKALLEIDRALAVSPNAQVWYPATRAVALHALGRSNEAVAVMENLNSSRPDDPDVLRHFGRLMGLNGRHEEGVRLAEKAVRLRPAQQTHLFLGRQYVMAGEYEKAVPELKEAIQLAPDRLLGHLWLAAAYSLGGKTEEARAEMEVVHRLNPDFSLNDCAHNSFNEYPPMDKKRFLDALEEAGLR